MTTCTAGVGILAALGVVGPTAGLAASTHGSTSVGCQVESSPMSSNARSLFDELVPSIRDILSRLFAQTLPNPRACLLKKRGRPTFRALRIEMHLIECDQPGRSGRH